MSLTPASKIRHVRGITEHQEQRICDFLQGAVYCWCKNRPHEWFALRDLMGGENYFWQGTPLIDLYEKQPGTAKEPEAAAGREGGWLLKKVLDTDQRLFETKVEKLVRHYRWTID